jgi:hypothetical protein
MDTRSQQHPRVAPDKIGPDDPRYAYLVRRGYNKRFAGRPDYVRLVGSTEQVVDAVQEAVRDNLRVAVRSGGHCLEGFVADPGVRVVIDTLLMTGVYFDQEIADGMRQRVNSRIRSFRSGCSRRSSSREGIVKSANSNPGATMQPEPPSLGVLLQLVRCDDLLRSHVRPPIRHSRVYGPAQSN